MFGKRANRQLLIVNHLSSQHQDSSEISLVSETSSSWLFFCICTHPERGMITRQTVGADPLSQGKECKSPASVCSEDGKGNESSLAASFVFVEDTERASTLKRHATVVHHPESIPTLLPGEERQALVHDVVLIHPAQVEGLKLFVTNLRMLLLGEFEEDVLELPLTSILDLKTSPRGLDVKTKDCRFFQIGVSNIAPLGKLLNSLIFQIPPSELFPLRRLAKGLTARHPSPLNLEEELARFGAQTTIKISEENSDFSLCHTYPRRLLVPATASKETLIGSSRFRDKGRMPVLSWIASSGASIWRSSQPKSSILNRSNDDEEYLRQTGVMFIIDCRPMLNAYANIANGAGVESLGNYHKGIELWFASIQNIHHVREAWEKIFSTAQQFYLSDHPGGTTATWFAGLETSGWLDLMSGILRASAVLVDKISNSKMSVLCRCSHGLDRTPQVVSLAMLALDPFYRTIRGFAILIEKEWISMGHKFQSRYCIGQNPHDDVSPIFSQWIECVYQLLLQYPDEFEFTSDYLAAILFGMLSGRFGNFLFDSEKERIQHGSIAEDGSVVDSVWPAIWRDRGMYENFNYQNRKTGAILLIEHRVSKLCLFNKLWLAHTRINFL